jgi:hypothetical protein
VQSRTTHAGGIDKINFGRKFEMKTKSQFQILTALLFAVLISVILTGCASMKVISSTPPVKVILVEKPVEFRFGLATKLTMPAGEYKPTLEDNSGYYYQAPTKLVARDILSYVADGGLIIKRGEKIPTRWYAIDEQNFVKTGKLPHNFQSKVIE